MFRPLELQVLVSKLESVEGFPFEFEMENISVQNMGSSTEGSKATTTQTSTPKSMEEVVVEVMQADKVVELFQTMAIVSLNMGNLTLKVNSLKNRLVIGEKEKAVLQEELNKDRDFQKGYKHNVENLEEEQGRG
jgi:hypothetical protein